MNSLKLLRVHTKGRMLKVSEKCWPTEGSRAFPVNPEIRPGKHQLSAPAQCSTEQALLAGGVKGEGGR